MRIESTKYTKRPGSQFPARKPAEAPTPGDTVVYSGKKAKRHSQILGTIGNAISKAPRALAMTSRFIGATLLGSLSAVIEVAAGSLGIAGMAGLGLAGALEIREGVQEKDNLKILGGTGEIVRGGFTGLLSAEHLLDVGHYSGTLGAATAVLGGVQGAIHLTSGVMKLRKGQALDNRQKRLEGYLEMGMGLASAAMVAGPLTPLAVGTYAALTTARYLLVNHERIIAGAKNAKKRTVNLWKAINSPPEEKKESPKPSPVSVAETPEARKARSQINGFRESPKPISREDLPF